MLIKKASDIRSSEITPKSVYLDAGSSSRRSGLAALAGGGRVRLVVGRRACAGRRIGQAAQRQEEPAQHHRGAERLRHITSYNNFYEFAPGAGDGPKKNSGKFKATPWTIEVEGLCNKPGKYNLEDFIKPFALEERVYRFRCVEAWSLVIPWVGIPLSDVIKRARAAGQGASSSRSPRWSTRPVPDAAHRPRSSGRTSKGCGSTRRCTR